MLHSMQVEHYILHSEIRPISHDVHMQVTLLLEETTNRKKLTADRRK